MRKDHEAIRKIMKRKKLWKPYEIQTQLCKIGRYYSESSITRRLREMRDVISCRPSSKFSRAWDYTLVK